MFLIQESTSTVDDAEGKLKLTEAQQIAKIILAPALTLLVRKVSAISGDIRYALDVLRRAIDLANPSTSSLLEDEEESMRPVGMTHVVEACKRASNASSSSSPTTTTSTATASGTSVPPAPKGPLHNCVASLSLQARLALVTILVARRRVAHGFASDSLNDASFSPSFRHPRLPSPSATPSTPTKVKKAASTSPSTPSSHSSSSTSVSSLSPSKLYTLYAHILKACPSEPFDAVSRNEFTDLLGVLETSSLLSLSLSSSSSARSSASPMGTPSKSKARPFGNGGSASPFGTRQRKASSFGLGGKRVEDGGVALVASEEEVLRALLASSEAEANGSAMEREVGKIWERESRRVERALAERTRKANEPVEEVVAREDYL